MKVHYTLILLCCFSLFAIVLTTANAQSPNYLWAKSAGGNSSDFGQCIAVDAGGNVLVAGAFSSPTLPFGATTLTNVGSADIFIAKYDPSGNVLWATSAGGATSESARSIASDLNGNVLVTGNFGSPTITFGTVTLTNTGSSDFFIVKYDPNGNVLWAKSASGSSIETGSSIAVDASGNIFTTGYFASPTVTFGSTVLSNSSANSRDVFIVKYDTNGNVLWAKNPSGSGNDEGRGIATDVSGNVVLTGHFESLTLTFGTTALTKVSGTGAGSDIFIAKYDPNGNVLWARNAGGNFFNVGYDIATDGSGSVLVTGSFQNPTLIFGTITVTNSTANSSDIFIAKYDASGNVLWAKSLGGTSSDIVSSITTDSNGNVLLTGYFRSPTVTVGSTTLSNSSLNKDDIFILKYDAGGNELWAKSEGGPESETGSGIATDGAGNVLVAGHFSSITITFGTNTLSNAVSNISADIFVIKLDNVTGIEENANEFGLILFPNPTNDLINLETIDGASVKNIELHDLKGELIKTFSPEQSILNIADIANGEYLLLVTSDQGFFTQKIIKR